MRYSKVVKTARSRILKTLKVRCSKYVRYVTTYLLRVRKKGKLDLARPTSKN